MADTSLEMNGVSATADGEVVVYRFPTRDLVTARNYLLIGGIAAS